MFRLDFYFLEPCLVYAPFPLSMCFSTNSPLRSCKTVETPTNEHEIWKKTPLNSYLFLVRVMRAFFQVHVCTYIIFFFFF